MAAVVIKCEVTYRMEITCCKCKKTRLTETFKKTIEGVPDFYELNNTHIGTKFPVSWASYLRPEGTVYECPACVKI